MDALLCPFPLLGIVANNPSEAQGSADVVFGVELVSINFRSDSSDQRDNFYTDDPCDAAAVAAGNASGKCSK